jgi:hypothetical protein
MGLDPCQVERVRRRRVQAGFRTAPAVVVLTDEHGVGQDDAGAARGRMSLERHLGIEVALVEAVEIDLERASDVRLVVGVVVEQFTIDLDRAVVTRRIRRR